MCAINLKDLDIKLNDIWGEILSQSKLVQDIYDKKITKELFAIYMLETYHYTRYNPINQAAVGISNINISHKYRNYCFKHAREEIGHEEMALHDIKELGFEIDGIQHIKPLPATETLIAYLYWISIQGNPIQRLGYSYWAESSYQYITPIIKELSQVLSLTDNQLSFFIAHSKIDEKHAKEVSNMIELYCQTENDFNDICRVMETSLRLTGMILSDVYTRYQKFLNSPNKSPCDLFN